MIFLVSLIVAAKRYMVGPRKVLKRGLGDLNKEDNLTVGKLS